MPTDGIEDNFSVDVTNDRGESPADTLLAIGLPPNPTGTPGKPGTQIANVVQLFNQKTAVPLYGVPLDWRFVPSNISYNYVTFNDPVTGYTGTPLSTDYQWGLSNTLGWDVLPGIHVKSITGYRAYSGSFTQDTTDAPLTVNMPTNYVTHNQFSEEVQISGTLFDQALEWVVGGYYLQSNDNNSGNVDQPGNVGGLGIDFLTDDPASDEDESGFAHFVYHITDQLSAEVGGRFSHETKDYTFFRYVPDLRGVVPPGYFPPISAAISPASRRRCLPARCGCRISTRRSGCNINGRRTS